MPEAHVYDLTVPAAAIDANGHVNNVEFVRWMQEAAVHHADARGLTEATKGAGATWVVRSHQIEYLRPAFAGDALRVLTWVADFRRAFSTRRYRFTRPADGAVVAKGETNWVFLDVATARPKSIPPELQNLFELPPEGWEP
jgi:acyl-CoA thioester hydrolase